VVVELSVRAKYGIDVEVRTAVAERSAWSALSLLVEW